jgi:hypothetical protein
MIVPAGSLAGCVEGSTPGASDPTKTRSCWWLITHRPADATYVHLDCTRSAQVATYADRTQPVQTSAAASAASNSTLQ